MPVRAGNDQVGALRPGHGLKLAFTIAMFRNHGATRIDAVPVKPAGYIFDTVMNG